MNKTLRTTLIVLISISAGYAAYRYFVAGFHNISDATAFLMSQDATRSPQKLQAMGPSYVIAWANAAKKGAITFKYQGVNYSSATGTRVV